MSEYDEWENRRSEFDEKPVRTTAKAMVRVWVLVIIGIVLVAAIGVATWFVKVSISDTQGAGDAEVIKNEAKNRIRAQEGFESLYAAIVTADQNLTLTADALKLSPQSQKLSIELTGQKMTCNDLVGRYNARARQFTQEEFRSAELPAQIGTLDHPATVNTDCKENTQ